MCSAACPALTAGCGGGTADQAAAEAAALPTWSYDSTQVFPADRSLTRPEDGIALADGP